LLMCVFQFKRVSSVRSTEMNYSGRFTSISKYIEFFHVQILSQFVKQPSNTLLSLFQHVSPSAITIISTIHLPLSLC
jgi:hypothetical protein